MSDEFDVRNKREWETAIRETFSKGIPQSAEFKQLEEIVRALQPFCKNNLNHTMLADGGGMDIIKVESGREEGCIDLWPSVRSTYVCKPSRLIFEYLPNSPLNSFLLLETNALQPSGIYEELPRPYEELVELNDGSFHDRSCWDQSSIGHDENGHEIPLPKDARLTCRFLSGKFLFVAKASRWNSDSATYDGRHSKMTAQQIRHAIGV